MNRITHGLTEHRIPAYMEEILTQNYCPSFMRMSMIRDRDSYSFSYRPGSLRRLNIQELDIYGKLVLLRSLITICRRAGEFLIGAENYLIEPELIFTENGGIGSSDIRILFYPDVKRQGLDHKLRLFAGRISAGAPREERDLIGQFAETLEGGDLNRATLFLEKNILRIEARRGHVSR